VRQVSHRGAALDSEQLRISDFARAIKHMRFPSRTRESPHFPASTRPIVKHIFGASRGDDGAELAAAEKSLMR
jgi:hypothetical protein